jgi:PPOX class probable F420-dependent enzyme
VRSARYLLLTTYRRDGTTVATPVWFAPAGRQLLIWTDARSGKVRRIRRDHRISVCTCTVRGRPSSQPAHGTAEFLNAEQSALAQRRLRRRYCLAMRLYNAYGTVRRWQGQAAHIALTVSGANEPGDPE